MPDSPASLSAASDVWLAEGPLPAVPNEAKPRENVPTEAAPVAAAPGEQHGGPTYGGPRRGPPQQDQVCDGGPQQDQPCDGGPQVGPLAAAKVRKAPRKPRASPVGGILRLEALVAGDPQQLLLLSSSKNARPAAAAAAAAAIAAAGPPPLRGDAAAKNRRKRKTAEVLVGPTKGLPICIESSDTLRFLRSCLPRSQQQHHQQQGERKSQGEPSEELPADAHASLAAWSLAYKLLQTKDTGEGSTKSNWSNSSSSSNNRSCGSSNTQAAAAAGTLLAVAVPLSVTARVAAALALFLPERHQVQQQQQQQQQLDVQGLAVRASGAASTSVAADCDVCCDGREALGTSINTTAKAAEAAAAAATPAAEAAAAAATPAAAADYFFPRVWVVCEDQQQAACLTGMLQRFLDSPKISSNNKQQQQQQQQGSFSLSRANGEVYCLLHGVSTVRQRQQFVGAMKRKAVAVFSALAFTAVAAAINPKKTQKQQQQQRPKQQQHQQQQQQQQNKVGQQLLAETSKSRDAESPQHEKAEKLHKDPSSRSGSVEAGPTAKSPQQQQQLLLLQLQLLRDACDVLIVLEAPKLCTEPGVAEAIHLLRSSSKGSQRHILCCSSFLPASRGELQKLMLQAKAAEALLPADVQQTLRAVPAATVAAATATDTAPQHLLNCTTSRFLLLLLQRRLLRCCRRACLEDSRLLLQLQQHVAASGDSAVPSSQPLAAAAATAPAAKPATAAHTLETPTDTEAKNMSDCAPAVQATAAPDPPRRQEPVVVSLSSSSSSSDEGSPRRPRGKRLRRAKPSTPVADATRAHRAGLLHTGEERDKASSTTGNRNRTRDSSCKGTAVAGTAISRTFQRYRRLIEAFSAALLAATPGLRQQRLLFSVCKKKQQQRQQQGRRCLGVCEVGITKDDVQRARASISNTARQQQQQQHRLNIKKTLIRRSLLQQSSVQQEALALECRFAMMLLEGRAQLDSGGPLEALEYLEAHATACSSATEGMQRHLQRWETQQLLAAARAAAATAAARMQQTTKSQDLRFGLRMELLLSLLQAFHKHYNNGSNGSCRTSGSRNKCSGDSSSSNKSAITSSFYSTNGPLHPTVDGGALVLTDSPEEAAAVAAALKSGSVSAFSVLLLKPAAADAAAVQESGGSSSCKRKTAARVAAAFDDELNRSSTSNKTSSNNGISPCGKLPRGSFLESSVLLHAIQSNVVVADSATAAARIPCCCRWRLLLLLPGGGGKTAQSWRAHRFAAACAEGLFVVRAAAATIAAETADKATDVAKRTATFSSRISGGAPPNSVGDCGDTKGAPSAADPIDIFDVLLQSGAEPLTVERLQDAAAQGGSRSLVISLLDDSSADAESASADNDEFFEALKSITGAAETGDSCCSSAEFLASCGSAVLLNSMTSCAASARAAEKRSGEPTGCFLLPGRRRLPMKCLVTANPLGAAGGTEGAEHDVEVKGKKRRCTSLTHSLGKSTPHFSDNLAKDCSTLSVEGCSSTKAAETPRGAPEIASSVDGVDASVLRSAEKSPSTESMLASDFPVFASACDTGLDLHTCDVEELQSLYYRKLPFPINSNKGGGAPAAARSDAAAEPGWANRAGSLCKRRSALPAEAPGPHTLEECRAKSTGNTTTSFFDAQTGKEGGASASDDCAAQVATSAKQARLVATDCITEALPSESQGLATAPIGKPKLWPSPSPATDEELHALLAADAASSLSPQPPKSEPCGFYCLPHHRQTADAGRIGICGTDKEVTMRAANNVRGGLGKNQREWRDAGRADYGAACADEAVKRKALLGAQGLPAEEESKHITRLRTMHQIERGERASGVQLWWLLPEADHPLAWFFC